jgi:hypothetical protein
MKSQKSLTRSKWLFQVLFLSTTTIISSCNKDSDKTYTVTVGVYILNGSTYEDQNKDLIFETQEGCQSWSRTAQADNHSSTTHDHFNAATNTTYDANNETISWTEYGPELDQSAIDATCEAGVDGAVKTANKTDYIVDKNFYLKIKSAIEN